MSDDEDDDDAPTFQPPNFTDETKEFLKSVKLRREGRPSWREVYPKMTQQDRDDFAASLKLRRAYYRNPQAFGGFYDAKTGIRLDTPGEKIHF